ncbi:MAG: HEAT repeat domain-containing protein [Planctomycetota bacterium]|nr:MAG: HEAT repeat domain-containing protein [Planctomycetota bacterium]
MRLALLLLLLSCAATPSLARGDFKTARRAYEDARAVVEEGRKDDPAALEAALLELDKQGDALVAADPVRGVEHLLEKGAASADRRVAARALRSLRQASAPKAKRTVARAFLKTKGRAKLLLAPVLGALGGAEATDALVRALKDRDPAVRAVSLKALATIGGQASAKAAHAVRRLLRDGSLRVRFLAADALGVFGQERPEAYPPPATGPFGLPDRYYVDRIAFLVDSSTEMAPARYQDPFAEDPAAQDTPGDGAAGGDRAPRPPKRRRKQGKDEPKEPEGTAPAPVAPFQLAGRMVLDAVGRLDAADTSFHLARFGRDLVSYASGWNPVPRKPGELQEWFAKVEPRDRNRDLARAFEKLLDLRPEAEEVTVFLAGPPLRRGRPDVEGTLERLADLLWGRDLVVNVVAFEPELAPARSATEKQRRSEDSRLYSRFVSALAKLGGGSLRTVPLARYVAEDEGAAKEEPAAKAFPVDLTKPIARKDLPVVRDALEKAIEKGDAEARAFIEDVAANPDPTKLAPQLLSLLRGEREDLARAVAAGIARNQNPKVHELVLGLLAKERDPARQLLLLAAVGPAGGAAVTEGLVELLGRAEGDVARRLWAYLAERPNEELALVRGKLARPAKKTSGLAAYHAARALARANRRPEPASQGLGIAEGRFLPERFLGTGTAFIIDTQRDAEALFWAPTAAPPAGADPGDAKGPKKKRKKRGRAPRKKEAAEDAPEPVSVLAAMRREVERALRSIARSGGKANVLTTGGKAWQPTAADASKKLDSALRFLADLRTQAARDLWTPLRKALSDPSVEEVYVLVCGPPIRSPGAKDPDELLRRVWGENRAREVGIQVVYVLPPVDADDPRASARRADLLETMNAIYGGLADENFGRHLVRSSLLGLGAKSP